MSELEPSFECISGELLWGQLHCLAEGQLAVDTDSPATIPNTVQNGKIFKRDYQYRVKAAKGIWNVKQINSRKQSDNSMFIAGFVVYHGVLADPVSIVKSCAEVGVSRSQLHDNKSIVYINRYDWSWCHDLPQNVKQRLYNGVSEEQKSKMFQMFAQRLILVDANFSRKVIDQLKESSFKITDEGLYSSTLIKESITADNTRIGIHLHCPDTEYERGWMVFNSEKEMIAFVYDGSNTRLEGELYMNDFCVRSADEWHQILKKDEEEEISNILNNSHGKSIDEIVHELLIAECYRVDLRSEQFESYRNTVVNWEYIVDIFEAVQPKNQ